mmetsp:Transcript_48161/g.102439  ORF Transcript_48161/g.102439 Transcript_48161/m.102439 type:complete len:109 (+) Transcript_48161:341-667(+)
MERSSKQTPRPLSEAETQLESIWTETETLFWHPLVLTSMANLQTSCSHWYEYSDGANSIDHKLHLYHGYIMKTLFYLSVLFSSLVNVTVRFYAAQKDSVVGNFDERHT